MWIGKNESTKFLAKILNSLRNCSVENILIVCTDNLSVFLQAVEATFPHTDIQNCIIRQLRNSCKYVSYKDLKTNLKKAYTVVKEDTAFHTLDEFATIWDSKYSKI